MRILLVHNFYGSNVPSGENSVVLIEKALLEEKGHTVCMFYRHSDEILNIGFWGFIKGAISTPWNFFSAYKLKKKIKSFKPDVLHVHNTFPLISPSIFSAVSSDVPVVLTLHNYRILCPAAIPMRNNKICLECIETKSVIPSILHRCYKSSFLATIPLAIKVMLHRHLGTWENNVDAIIVFSSFQKNLLASSGLPLNKMFIKPNFFEYSPRVIPWIERNDYVVFVGRLTEEKGLLTLFRAWELLGDKAPELRVIGDGPLRESLEQFCYKNDTLNISFMGHLTKTQVEFQISFSKLLILPSECYEGFPMVLREAFAFGTPVAVSNLGPLPDIVADNITGVLFEPADPNSIYAEILRVFSSNSILEEFSYNSRMEFENKYNKNTNYNILMEIYNNVIENKFKGVN